MSSRQLNVVCRDQIYGEKGWKEGVGRWSSFQWYLVHEDVQISYCCLLMFELSCELWRKPTRNWT